MKKKFTSIVLLLLLVSCSYASSKTFRKEPLPSPTERVINGPTYIITQGTWFLDNINIDLLRVRKVMLNTQTDGDMRFIPANNASKLYCEHANYSKYCNVEEIHSSKVGWIERSVLAYENPPEIKESVPIYKVKGATWFLENPEGTLLEEYTRMQISYTENDERFIPANHEKQITCKEIEVTTTPTTFCFVESLKTGEVGWVDKKAMELEE